MIRLVGEHARWAIAELRGFWPRGAVGFELDDSGATLRVTEIHEDGERIHHQRELPADHVRLPERFEVSGGHWIRITPAVKGRLPRVHEQVAYGGGQGLADELAMVLQVGLPLTGPIPNPLQEPYDKLAADALALADFLNRLARDAGAPGFDNALATAERIVALSARR